MSGQSLRERRGGSSSRFLPCPQILAARYHDQPAEALKLELRARGEAQWLGRIDGAAIHA